MLKCIEEINEKNKRYKAYFTNGKTTKFGQSNPKKGTYIDHGDEKLRKNYINKPTLKESMKDYNIRIKYNYWDIKI